jgi:hypothetical protein
MEIMLKKIKNKICEIICKVFKIKPCVCDHECNCNKGEQIMGDLKPVPADKKKSFPAYCLEMVKLLKKIF